MRELLMLLALAMAIYAALYQAARVVDICRGLDEAEEGEAA